MYVNLYESIIYILILKDGERRFTRTVVNEKVVMREGLKGASETRARAVICVCMFMHTARTIIKREHSHKKKIHLF